MIRPAQPDDIATVRELFREYAAWIGSPVTSQRVEQDLATMPDSYQALLLAFEDGKPAGCAALRQWQGGIGEMKRLYVRDSYQGRGIGRLLVEQIVAEARAAGFRRLRLDTLPMMTKAIAMYRALGFSEIPRYGDHLAEAICFELSL